MNGISSGATAYLVVVSNVIGHLGEVFNVIERSSVLPFGPDKSLSDHYNSNPFSAFSRVALFKTQFEAIKLVL